MLGGRKKESGPAPSKPDTAAPKDALAALMEGETPNKQSLQFPGETDYEPARRSFRDSRKGSGRFEEYEPDHSFEYKPSASYGEYEPQQGGGTLDTMKNGAVRSGTYVKDKAVAGTTYLKERDWSREKEFAGKAGTATKSGAMYVGSGVAKGASWIWNSSKQGVDNIKNRK